MSDPLEIFTLSLGPLQANCFIALRGSAALLIDPGDEAEAVTAAFDELGVTPSSILVTHGHFDHFGAVAPLARRYAAPVYAGEADAAQMADPSLGPLSGFGIESVADCMVISGEQELDLAIPVTAIPTPGHSRGSYTFATEGHLFTGDLIFLGSIGRTDLPGGSSDELLDSVARLVRRFPPDTVVHCGHGPDTSLGRELALNPFLSPLRHQPEHRW
jgi:hydroxyacylglutathione hydrolase